MTDERDPQQRPGADDLPRPFGTHYVLVDRIGVGGMAEIFLARGKTQSGAGRLAVVKLVLPKLANDERFSTLLVQEAKLAAQLSHGNVVQTFDLGREAGRLYIAMEYVEGFDLNELLKRCSRAKVPLPFEFALLIVSETLRALDYAHRKKDQDGKPLGIVHRDVSPSNVLVSFEGEVKLCDFGIARALNGGDAPGDAIEGKASYMSPEHARGDSVDARADVFSASVILWELVAGRRMYRAHAGADLITLARNGDTPELPDRDLPDLERLRAIVRKGLAKSPADRYATAHAMVRELDDYVMDNRLMATPMALGEFVVEHFGQEILELRRARERAAIAMESSGTDAQASEWDDATAIERSPLAETPVTLPHAPTTDTERDASVSVERGTTNWPSAFPPPAIPSIPPPSGIQVPQSIEAPQRAPAASSQSESNTMILRLVGLVLGALVTIALGALILGRR